MPLARWLAVGALLLSVVSTECRLKQQCPKQSFSEALLQDASIDNGIYGTSGWAFPTNNRLYSSNSSWWKPQKDMEGHQHSSQAVPAFIKAVVFFYVSPHCPYSKAVSSVIACLPKFFPPTVVFFAVDVGTLPRNLVLNNGVVATPRVRMLRKNTLISMSTDTYALEALLDFVENESGQEAVAGVEDISRCGSAPGCSCATEVREVTARDIAALGNNRWMLLACLFLASVVTYSFRG